MRQPQPHMRERSGQVLGTKGSRSLGGRGKVERQSNHSCWRFQYYLRSNRQTNQPTCISRPFLPNKIRRYEIMNTISLGFDHSAVFMEIDVWASSFHKFRIRIFKPCNGSKFFSCSHFSRIWTNFSLLFAQSILPL